MMPLPDSAALLERAKALRHAGNLEESALVYEQLVSLGYAAEGSYGLGLIRMDAHDLEGARAHFERTLDVDPGNANALFYLGEIWAAQGAAEVARGFYRRALELNPTHATARERLGPPPTTIPHTEKSAGTPPQADTSQYEKRTPGGLYDLLRLDPSPLAQQTLSLIDTLKLRARPAASAYLGTLLILALIGLVPALAIRAVPVSASTPLKVEDTKSETGNKVVNKDVFTKLSPDLLKRPIKSRSSTFPANLSIGAIQLGLLAAGLLPIAFLVKVKSRVYTLDHGRLQIAEGVLFRKFTNVELYRVVDLELRQSFLNRLTGDGTILLLIEGGRAGRSQMAVPLTGIARGAKLHELFEKLRSLVLLLRTGNWGKGFIT